MLSILAVAVMTATMERTPNHNILKFLSFNFDSIRDSSLKIISGVNFANSGFDLSCQSPKRAKLQKASHHLGGRLKT